MRGATKLRHFEFDDLLDAAPAPANDVTQRLRALAPTWALRATVTLDSEDHLYAGLSYDLASGGVFVATFDPPPIGARVSLTLTLGYGRELAVSGKVRWIRGAADASDGIPAGCGVEVEALPLDARDTLEALSRDREPMLWLADIG